MGFWGIVAQFALSVGFGLLSRLFAPKRERREGPRLDDLRVQVSTYGTSIPRVYGTVRLAGNIIQSSSLIERTEETDDETTYKYSATFAVSLCKGVANKLLRIWADGKLIYNGSGTGPQVVEGRNFVPRFYKGTATQAADPAIQALKGAANTPAYRGLVYCVFEDMQLENFGNRIPNLEFEISMQAADTFPLGTQLTVPVQNDLLLLDHLRPYLYVNSNSGWARVNRHTGQIESSRVLSPVVKGTGISPDGFLFGHQGVSNYDALVMLDAYGFGVVDGIGSSGAFFGIGNPFSCRDDTIQNFGYQVALIHPILGPVVYDIGFGGQITALFYQGQLPTCYAGEPHPPSLLSGGLPLGICGVAGALNSSLVFGIGYSSCVDKYGSLWTTSGFSTNDTDFGLTRISLGFFQGLFGGFDISLTARHWVLNGYMKRGNNALMYDPATHQLIIFGQSGTADAKVITSLTRTSNTVAAVVPGHGFSVGNIVGIRDTTDPTFHGVFQVATVPDGNNFTYVQTAADAVALGGTTILYPQGIAKWDIATEQFTGISHRYGPDVFMASAIRGMQVPGVTSRTTGDGTFVIDAGGVTKRFRISDLSVEQTYNLGLWSSVSRFGWLYDSEVNALWVIQTGGKLQPYYLDRAASSSVTLASIVQDLCLEAGLQLGDIDTTQLNSILVKGYIVSRQGTVKSAIEPLMLAYFFNARESDGKVQFVLRGGSTVATVEEKYLGAAVPGQSRPRVIEPVVQEVELPEDVEITFIDQFRDYQEGTQGYKRIAEPTAAMDSREQWSFQLPIVLADTEARQIAEKSLFLQWAERYKYQFELPSRFLRLDPADPIIVKYRGRQIRMMLTKISLKEGYRMACDAVSDDAEFLIGQATGVTGTGVPIQTIPGTQFTEPLLLDVNLLRDEDWNNSTSGIYVGFGGLEAGWPGAVLYKSPDGSTWNQLLSSNRTPNWGRAATVLPKSPFFTTWDRVNTVTVWLVQGALQSSTEALVLEGANTAVLGREVIQFVNAVQNGDGSWTLSTLLRGRRGSEPFEGLHAIGDVFVMVQPTNPLRQRLPISEFNVQRFYKMVTLGGNFSLTPTVPLKLACADLKCYAPWYILGSRDGSLNLTVTWLRRTRVGGAWRDSVGDAPLGEDAEAYEVEILDSNNVVKRTFTGLTTPTVAYTAAQQTTDFGAAQSAVKVAVYQMSGQIGRGYAGRMTV